MRHRVVGLFFSRQHLRQLLLLQISEFSSKNKLKTDVDRETNQHSRTKFYQFFGNRPSKKFAVMHGSRGGVFKNTPSVRDKY